MSSSRDGGPERRRRSRTVRALQSALTRTFAETNRRHFQYGLRVRSASPDLRHIDVALGYLSGEVYCCGALGCSIPYYERSWWRRLRKNLEREGLTPPARPITLHVAEIMEPGAVFPILGASACVEQLGFHEQSLEEAEAGFAERLRRSERGRS